MVKEYTVITRLDYHQFIAEVNKLAKEGWFVQGGVSVTATGGMAFLYAQALVR